MPLTVVAPKRVVPAAVVVVVRLAVLPLMARLPAACSVLLPLAVSAAVNAPLLRRLMLAPVAVKAVLPLKLFVLSARVTLLPVATTALVPATASVPVWLTAPALVTSRVPLMVVAPKRVVPADVVLVVRLTVLPLTTRSPAACSVLLPLAVSAAVNALLSRRLMTAPVTLAVPPKLLLLLASVTLLTPASITLLPVTARLPVWLTAPVLVTSRLPLTAVAPNRVVPAAVVVVVRLAVLPLMLRSPAACSVLLPLAVSAAVNAPLLRRLMLAPLAVTAPLKSLAAASSVTDRPAALMPVVPSTFKAPVWLTAPPATTFNAPVKLNCGRASPAVVNCKSRLRRLVGKVGNAAALWILRSAISCSVLPPVALMLTGPAKLLSALASRMFFAPAVSTVKLLLPGTIKAPVCEMLPPADTAKLAPRVEPASARLLALRIAALLAPELLKLTVPVNSLLALLTAMAPVPPISALLPPTNKFPAV